MTLSNATLSALALTIARPGYDRAALTPGIVHVGCGNFHRAHMAVYLDDLFALGEGHDWALLGAGVREGDARMREVLAAQDYLSSVIELAPGAHSARVIGAMTGFVPVEPGNPSLIAAMADPAIRIVSLTVTEGGYYIDPKTGTFSPDHPDIQHDAANPDRPGTVFGAIVAALRARRAAGVQPFTVIRSELGDADGACGAGQGGPGRMAGDARGLRGSGKRPGGGRNLRHPAARGLGRGLPAGDAAVSGRGALKSRQRAAPVRRVGAATAVLGTLWCGLLPPAF